MISPRPIPSLLLILRSSESHGSLLVFLLSHMSMCYQVIYLFKIVIAI